MRFAASALKGNALKNKGDIIVPKFSYIAKDEAGKTIKDTIDAVSRSALVDKLQKQNFFIVEVSEVARSNFSSKKRSQKKRKQFRRNKIKLQDFFTTARHNARSRCSVDPQHCRYKVSD